MKRLLFLLITLLIATLLGLGLADNSGYLIIYYHHWRLAATLIAALVSLIIISFVSYLFIRLLRGLFYLPSQLQQRRKKRAYTLAQQLTNQGLCYLAEGLWIKAERYLIKAAKYTQFNLINYLSAARAAHEQQAFARRDDYLRLACRRKRSRYHFATGLTQAQLQLDSKQWEQALATLQHLHQIKPDHRYTLKLLKIAYYSVKDWQALSRLLPKLLKHRILTQQAQKILTEEVYYQLLKLHADKSIEQLRKYWQSLSKDWQVQTNLVKQYASELCKKGYQQEAINCLLVSIKQTWNSDLALLYCQLVSSDVSKQITTMEHFYQQYKNDAKLLLGIGILYFREQLWGKALDYFKRSIALQEKSETYYYLGRVFEQQNQIEQALHYYRKSTEATKLANN